MAGQFGKLLAVLQERDQVGELFFRQLLLQSGGHD
jgi:hypothetical protein